MKYTYGLAALLCAGLTQVSSANMVFATNEVADLIMKFEESTGEYKGAFSSFTTGTIVDMECGLDGYLYVLTTEGGGKIIKLNPYDGTYAGSFATGFLTSPRGLAVSPTGQLYVSQTTTPAIVRFETDGTYKGSFGDGFVNTSFYGTLACDSNDIVYAINTTADQIVKFVGSTGEFKGFVGTGFSPNFWSLATDNLGMLYARTYSGTVHEAPVMRFDSTDGTYKGTFGNGFIYGSGIEAGLIIMPDGTAIVNTYMGGLGHSLMRFNAADGKYEGYFGFGFINGYALAQERAVPITGKITLEACATVPAGTNATISVYKAGTNAILEQYTVPVAADGSYSVKVYNRGSLDIYAKTPRNLQKKVTVVNDVDGLSGVNFTNLLGGDANNDNYIGTDDYLILNGAFDTFLGDALYDSRADFKCDNYIGTDDYLVLNGNFDTLGDAP